MIDLFIDENDLTEIKIYVGIENGKLVASSKAEEIKEVALTNSIWVKQLDYRTNASITSQSVTIKGGDFQIDPAALRYKTLVNSIVKWDLKDAKNNDVKCDQTNIGKLNPVLAGAITNALDQLKIVDDKNVQNKG